MSFSKVREQKLIKYSGIENINHLVSSRVHADCQSTCRHPFSANSLDE